MAFRNAPVPQNDGSTDWTKNCVPATCADIIDRTTVSATRVLGSEVRKASGVSGRGLMYSEAAAATLKLTTAKGRPVRLEPRYGLSRSTVRDTVAGGSVCGISIDTSVTRYTTRRTNYYVGGHTVYLLVYSWWPAGDRCTCEKLTATAHGEYTVDDPGTTAAGYLQWSADLVYRAAEKRTSYHGINLLVGPDTETVKWVGKESGAIRNAPRNDSPKEASVVVGRTYFGGRTDNGGSWDRSNGTKANGWIHVAYSGTSTSDYKWGWVMGRRMRRA